MRTIKSALNAALSRFTDANEHRIDCEVLMCFVLGKPRTYLYTHPEHCLNELDYQSFIELIERRQQGEPIAYITSEKEFWSLPLTVTSDTLIPRPETELMIEVVLNLLKNLPSARIIDLGTGAGSIALALAKERPNWHISACDISEAALKVAQHNAQKLGLNNITFYHSDWFDAILPQQFDAILSNPPYIASDDPHVQQGDLRFEPHQALVSGTDGLKAIHKIIQQSLARLEKNGLLLVEHGYNQKNAIRTILTEYGYQYIKCWQDWQGHDRLSGGKRIDIDE